MELITYIVSLFTQFLDIILHLDVHLNALVAEYGVWIYAILFLIIFCETGLVVTPFLPGDSLLFVAGAIAATTGGGLDIWPLSISLFVAAVVGDNVNYWIGRHIGKRVFSWNQSRFFNRAAFDKAHAFFERHGGKTIIVARFMPIVRTFSPFVAGVAAMNYRRFLPLDIFGGALWIFSLCFAGYFFGNIPFVKHNLTLLIVAIILVSFMPLIVAWIKSRLQPKSV